MAYTIGDRISESATTSVYVGFDEALRRRVLLKVLHRHLAHDEQVRQRFVREARACAALRSEYIVQIFELSEHEGSPAIVMEFVEGLSLKDVITQGGGQKPQFAQKVAVHVLRGLAMAHANGIVHRDIKPGNILVSEQGIIKLTDFGLAQFSLSPTITTEGSVVGTPAYIAPEIIRGEPADVRTDLFSLGATLVEVLSGKRLFEGATYSECLQRISNFRTEMLDRFVPLCSPGFVEFLKRLMDPDPSRRFSSAREALSLLGKAGSSVIVGGTHRRKHRNRRIVIGASAVVVTVFAAAVFFAVSQRPGTDEKPPGLNTVAPVDSSAQRDTNGRAPQLPMQPGPSVRRDRAAVPAPAGRPRPAIVADSGDLLITSAPWAKVTVDDRLIGELPLDGPLRLAAGMHTVVFTHPMFEPIVRSVTVAGGGRETVHGDFLSNAGYLKCSATPWAEVFVDEQYKETTPFAKPILLSAGMHRVRFHHSSFPDIIREVTISPRDTATLTVNFSR